MAEGETEAAVELKLLLSAALVRAEAAEARLHEAACSAAAARLHEAAEAETQLEAERDAAQEAQARLQGELAAMQQQVGAALAALHHVYVSSRLLACARAVCWPSGAAQMDAMLYAMEPPCGRHWLAQVLAPQTLCADHAMLISAPRCALRGAASARSRPPASCACFPYIPYISYIPYIPSPAGRPRTVEGGRGAACAEGGAGAGAGAAGAARCRAAGGCRWSQLLSLSLSRQRCVRRCTCTCICARPRG